jgi:hypothetical protein
MEVFLVAYYHFNLNLEIFAKQATALYLYPFFVIENKLCSEVKTSFALKCD